MAIVQPYENLITYYDGARGVYPGCAYSEVFPVLREWLRHAYSALGLSDSQAVEEWTIRCPPDAPHQTYGLNCGPNTLIFLYFWITHKRPSTTRDWDPYNPDPAVASSQVKEMREFISYHLLSQGGREHSLTWKTSSSTLADTPPLDILADIRQAFSKVESVQSLRRAQRRRERELSHVSLDPPAGHPLDSTPTLSTT